MVVHMEIKLVIGVKQIKIKDMKFKVINEETKEVVERNLKVPRKIIREIPVEKMLSTTSKQVLQLQSDYDTEDIDHSIGIKKEVGDAINTLKDRERDIIRMHFGIGMKEPMALSDIAKEFGLTKERTRQIKEKAIRRLRHESRSKKLSPYALISPSAKKEALNERGFYHHNYSQKHTRVLEQENKKQKELKEKVTEE